MKKTNADAMKADSDGDSLKDGDEVNRHKTNPLKADTDNGTVSDGAEVARGGNPNDASDDVPPKPEIVQVQETAKPALQAEVGKAIVLEGVVFKSGSAVISPQSEEILTKALPPIAFRLKALARTNRWRRMTQRRAGNKIGALNSFA